MAVDTATKRYTITSVTLPWRGISSVPDGTVADVDRLAFAYLYAGIAPTSSADLVTPWHSLALTSFTTHESGYESRPTVVRNTDQPQVIQADIDE